MNMHINSRWEFDVPLASCCRNWSMWLSMVWIGHTAFQSVKKIVPDDMLRLKIESLSEASLLENRFCKKCSCVLRHNHHIKTLEHLRDNEQQAYCVTVVHHTQTISNHKSTRCRWIPKRNQLTLYQICAEYSSLLSAASRALIHLPSTFPMDIPSII